MNLNKLFETSMEQMSKSQFKRKEMQHELGHEEAMNNHKVTIDGRDWKVFSKKSTAEKAAATIRSRNPNKEVRIYATMEPVSEGRMEGVHVLGDLERIVDNKSAGVVKFEDGKSKVDMYTASAIMQVYNAVNDENKKKIERMIDTKTGFMAIAKFAFKRRTNEQSVTESNDHSEVVRLGRILMNMATEQKDEALSNAMSILGSELTKFGTPTGARGIADLNKRTGLTVSTIEKMMAMADKFGDEGLSKIRDPEPQTVTDDYESKLGEKYQAHKNKMGEGIEQEKFQGAEGALVKYANERGGSDKADFMEVAKMLGQIGRINILQAGQVLSRLERKLDHMDTDPRDKVLEILRDFGLYENRMQNEVEENIDSRSTDAEYKNGRKAAGKKVSYDDNPNQRGTAEYTAWSKGHNDARAEMLARRHTAEGYRVVPDINRERYQERPGLEGPYRADNGKVVYYDPKEGLYYDPDTDMYISQTDWDSMNEEATANIQDFDDADDTVFGNVMVDGDKVGTFLMYGTTGGVDAFNRTFNTIDDMLSYAEERFEGVAEAVEADITEAREPGEYRTIRGVRYYIVKNKSGKSKAFSGPTAAAKKYAQSTSNWYDESITEAYRDEIMIGDHVITKKGGQMQGVVTGFSTKSGDTRVMFKHESGKVYATYPENLTILNKVNEGGFFDPDQPNPGDMVKHRNGAVGKVKKIGTQGDETFVYFRDENGEMNYGQWKKHVFPMKEGDELGEAMTTAIALTPSTDKNYKTAVGIVQKYRSQGVRAEPEKKGDHYEIVVDGPVSAMRKLEKEMKQSGIQFMATESVDLDEALTEEQFDEAAGEKDACYHKVKSRYKVWPSAYASGALVQCRKVGAANWGNKSKK